MGGPSDKKYNLYNLYPKAERFGCQLYNGLYLHLYNNDVASYHKELNSGVIV